MASKLYVGNISYDTTEADLTTAFGHHGSVVSAKVVSDRDTGRPRGFAFVEMASPADAQAAIGALNETQLGGRTIQVSEARPRNDGGSGGRSGGSRSRW